MKDITFKNVVAYLFTILCVNAGMAQTQESVAGECTCSENNYAPADVNLLFDFTNNKKIVACGYVIQEEQETA